MYNELVFSLWAYTDDPNPEQALTDTDSLCRFQVLVQQLVSLEENASRISTGNRASGSRLDAIQRDVIRQHLKPPARPGEDRGAAQPINIPAAPETTGSLGPFAVDGFQLDEFLHLELFEDNPSMAATESGYLDQSLGWKDILPVTVLLLASVAFSFVLTMVLGALSGQST